MRPIAARIRLKASRISVFLSPFSTPAPASSFAMRAAALRAAALVRRRQPGDSSPPHLRSLASAPPAGSSGSGDEDGGAELNQPCTPWVRTVVSGVDLMRNPK